MGWLTGIRRAVWPLVTATIGVVAWTVGDLQRDALFERIETQGRQELDLFVAADMVQLEQVLANLIGNACDAMAGRPERRVRLCGWQDGLAVRLQVSDTGPGIAADKLDRIFDPFFTTSDAGLGLGLSISHTIVTRLGGSLTAGNAVDGGAIFTLVLEAWKDTPAVAAAGEPA